MMLTAPIHTPAAGMAAGPHTDTSGHDTNCAVAYADDPFQPQEKDGGDDYFREEERVENQELWKERERCRSRSRIAAYRKMLSLVVPLAPPGWAISRKLLPGRRRASFEKAPRS